MPTKSELKYRRLMEVAGEEFFRRGYKAVSMDELAKKANISKMTIYKHFHSKEALFLAILLQVIDEHFERIKVEIAKVSGTVEKINFLMNYSLQQLENYSFEFYKETLDMTDLLEKIIAVKMEKNTALFREIVVEGIKNKELGEVDPDLLADTLVTMLEVFGRKYMRRINSGEDIEKLTKQMYSILKYGLLGCAGGNENG